MNLGRLGSEPAAAAARRVALLGAAALALLLLISGCGHDADQPDPPSTTVRSGGSGQGSGAPPAGEDPTLSRFAEQALAQLSPGTIAFNRPDQLRVGSATRIQVRVARRDMEGLLRGFTGPGELEQRSVMVSTLLSVALVGDPDVFRILPLTNQDQPVLQDTFTQWEWAVTPTRAGTHSLYIRVSLRLNVPDTPVETLDRTVLAQPVTVEVDPVYMAQRFVGANWAWLAPSVLLPAGAWILRGLRRRGANGDQAAERAAGASPTSTPSPAPRPRSGRLHTPLLPRSTRPPRQRQGRRRRSRKR